MKTIANCTPSEFLSQTYMIVDKVMEYFDKTQLLEIRKCLPKFEANETDEMKKEKLRKQGVQNLKKMIEKMMKDDAENTAKILGLFCFIPEEDINNHTGLELLIPVIQILNNKDIIDFLLSLANLEQ